MSKQHEQQQSTSQHAAPPASTQAGTEQVAHDLISSNDIPSAEQLYERLKAGVAELMAPLAAKEVHLVGIYSGGAWLAQRLHQDLGLTTENALLNTSLYRDDFKKIGLHGQKLPSKIPFDVNDKHLILVDDILYTGRSVRAALNELFDVGRPASIRLAVLLDRGGRELPIQPDVVGLVCPLPAHRRFVLSQDEAHVFDIGIKDRES